MKRWFSLRLGRVCWSRQCVWDGFLSIDCFDASVGQIDDSVHGYTSSRIQGISLMRLLTSSSILGILLHTNCMRNGIEYTQIHTQPTHIAHVIPSLNQPSNYTCFRVPFPSGNFELPMLYGRNANKLKQLQFQLRIRPSWHTQCNCSL